MRFGIPRLSPHDDGGPPPTDAARAISDRDRGPGIPARGLSRKHPSTWAGSLFISLLVACLIGAPTPARATTAPYTLLGMFPGNDAESGVLGDPSAGALQQVAPSPAMILTELPAFTQWAGKGNLIVNTYDYTLDETVPQGNSGVAPNTLLADLNAIWAEGAVPMLSWGRGVDLINSGALDSEIKAEALTLKTWLSGNDGTYGEAACSGPVWSASCDDRRIYFRPFWESNGNWYTGWSPCSSNTTTSFIAAWRRVHDIFTSVGLDNSHVAWVYSVNWNSSCPAGDPVNTYPGSNYVDWVGIDGYNTFTGPSSTPSDVFGPMVSKLSTIDPTKPMGIDEAGADSIFGTQDKNQYISEYFPYIANNNIRMAVWFNENVGYSVPPGTTQTDQWAIFEQEYPQDALPSYGDQSFQYTVNVGVPNVAHVSAHTDWRGFSSYQAGVQSSSLVGSCGADSCSPPGHIQSTQEFLGQ